MKKIFVLIAFLTSLYGYSQDTEYYGKVTANALSETSVIDTLVVQDKETGELQRFRYSDLLYKLNLDLTHPNAPSGFVDLTADYIWTGTHSFKQDYTFFDKNIILSHYYEDNRGGIYWVNGDMPTTWDWNQRGNSGIELEDGLFAGLTMFSDMNLYFVSDFIEFKGSTYMSVYNDQEFVIRKPIPPLFWTSTDLFVIDTAGVTLGDTTVEDISDLGVKAVPTVEWVQNYVEEGGHQEQAIIKLIGDDPLENYIYTAADIDRSMKDPIIGKGSLDLLVVDSIPSGDRYGLTADYAFGLGYNNRIEGWGSFFMGSWNYQTELLSEVHFSIGYGNRSDGWGSFTMGAYQNQTSNYTFNGGTSNKSGNGGVNFLWGGALDASGSDFTTFFGVNNVIPALNGGNIFSVVVGNGDSSVEPITNRLLRGANPSNSFELYNSGKLTLPSFELGLYNDPKDVVTVEKATAMLLESGGGIPDAPSDGTLYGRQDGNWQNVGELGIGEAPINGLEYLRQNGGWVINTDENSASSVDEAADYDWTGSHSFNTNPIVLEVPEDESFDYDINGHWLEFNTPLGERIFDIGWNLSYDETTNYIGFYAGNGNAAYQTVFSFGNSNLTAQKINGVYIDDGVDGFSIEFGYAAGSYDATASVAIGGYAGTNMEGWQMTALGSRALENTIGDWNVGIGPYAASHAQGDNNIAIGQAAGYWLDGDSNVSIGAYSAYDWPSVPTPTLSFASSAVDVVADLIYVPNHGLGAAGTVVKMLVEHIPDITGTPFGGLSEYPLNFIVIDANNIDPYQANLYGTDGGVQTFNLYKAFPTSNTVNIGNGANPQQSNQVTLGGSTHTRVSHGMTNYAPTYGNDLIDKNYADQLVLSGGGTPDQTISFDSATNLLTISGNLDTADLSSLDNSSGVDETADYNWTGDHVFKDRIDINGNWDVVTGGVYFSNTANITYSEYFNEGMRIGSGGYPLTFSGDDVVIQGNWQHIDIKGGSSYFSMGYNASWRNVGYLEEIKVDTAGVTMPDSNVSKINLKGAKAVTSVEWVQDYVGTLGGTDDQTLGWNPATNLLSIEGGNSVTLGFTEEAPINNNLYGRYNGEWVEFGVSGEQNVQSDWNITDNSLDSYIRNKPTTITASQASQIADNTLKVGITTSQAVQIADNTLKVGITSTQAGNILTNNGKISFPEAPVDSQQYARQNGEWAVVVGGAGGDGDITGVNITASNGLTGTKNTTIGTHIQTLGIATGGVTTTMIADNSLREQDLLISNGGVNNRFLTYNSVTGGFTWDELIGGTGIQTSANNISLGILTQDWDASDTFDISAGGFYESSLRALKVNVTPFTKSGLELIGALDIMNYDRMNGGAKDKIGIMVDESPKEFANEDGDAVDLYKTIFIQAKAIQELEKRLIDLEKRVKDLEDEK